MKLNKILEHKVNVAEVLSEDKLTKIGNDVVEGYFCEVHWLLISLFELRF